MRAGAPPCTACELTVYNDFQQVLKKVTLLVARCVGWLCIKSCIGETSSFHMLDQDGSLSCLLVSLGLPWQNSNCRATADGWGRKSVRTYTLINLQIFSETPSHSISYELFNITRRHHFLSFRCSTSCLLWTFLSPENETGVFDVFWGDAAE
eukprot:COSAG02_NODE_5276_length_4478_cov_1.851108_3_plen_152_part_00